MDIKVYGTATPGHQMVISLLREFLIKAEIPFSIREVNEISAFLNKGLDSVPAIQVDDREILPLKSNGSFNRSLRGAINKILSRKNYGKLPKFIIPVNFTDQSLNALFYGHRLATDFGAITKVIYPQPENSIENLSSAKAAPGPSQANSRLRNIVHALDIDWGSDILKASLISEEFRTGTAAETILKSVDENIGKLAVLSVPALTSPDGANPRSIYPDILQHSTCPVLLIPENSRYKGISKILLLIDHEPPSEEALDRLAGFCEPLRAEIHLGHPESKDSVANLDRTFSRLRQKYPGSLIKSAELQSNVSSRQSYIENNDINVISFSSRSGNHLNLTPIHQSSDLEFALPLLAIGK